MRTETQSETLSWPPEANGEAVREEWVAAVEQVISDAEAWATEQNWFVHRGPKTITESRIGTYEVPVLLIQAPAGRFVIDPIARYVIGALGKIEFCVFPSYDYVMIIRTEAGWQFETNPRTVRAPGRSRSSSRSSRSWPGRHDSQATAIGTDAGDRARVARGFSRGRELRGTPSLLGSFRRAAGTIALAGPGEVS